MIRRSNAVGILFTGSQGAFGLWTPCVAQADALTLIRRPDLVQADKRVGTVSPPKLADLLAAVGHVIGADCEPVSE